MTDTAIVDKFKEAFPKAKFRVSTFYANFDKGFTVGVVDRESEKMYAVVIKTEYPSWRAGVLNDATEDKHAGLIADTVAKAKVHFYDPS